MLGLPVRGYRVAQPDQVREGRDAIGDLEHRELGALRVLQQQPGRVRVDGAGRTSKVTGTGQAVPSGSLPAAVTESTSAVT